MLARPGLAGDNCNSFKRLPSSSANCRSISSFESWGLSDPISSPRKIMHRDRNDGYRLVELQFCDGVPPRLRRYAFSSSASSPITLTKERSVHLPTPSWERSAFENGSSEPDRNQQRTSCRWWKVPKSARRPRKLSLQWPATCTASYSVAKLQFSHTISYPNRPFS